MIKLVIGCSIWGQLIFILWTLILQRSGANGNGDKPTINCHMTIPVSQVHWNESWDIADPVFNCSVSLSDDLIITSGNTDNMLLSKTDQTSGFVYFAKTPSYEEYQEFDLEVAAQGGGDMTPWGGDIIIRIDDSNTYYPIFSPLSVLVSVKENFWNNDIANFTVTDGDSSPTFGIKSVTYSFKPPTGDYDGTFNLSSALVSSDSFVSIGLQEQLDYETTVFYYVILVAMDGGGYYTDANVIVNVIDQEDMPPEFTKIAPYTGIYENATIDTLVFQVTAIDGDRGINHAVRYAIDSGNVDDDFIIDVVNGTVKVNHKLDADSKTRPSLYTLSISATEQNVTNKTAPYVSSTICIISVIDVDNNPPVFSFASYNASIDELSVSGTEVTFKSGHSIAITDADLGENAAFTVVLMDDTGIFVIDPLQGEKQQTFSIVVNDSDRLNCDILQSIDMTVVVTDNNVPSFVNMASIQVKVNDVNNHWPEFSVENYTVEINETTVAGTDVIAVTAIDRDIDERYNRVYYRMEGGSGASSFTVDVMKGIIMVAAGVTLDRDIVPNYLLTVNADDGTVHPDASSNDTCSVQITLLDVNNKPPLFDADGGKFAMSIDENTINDGDPIIRANASDPDSDNLLEYRIDYALSVAYDNADYPLPQFDLGNITIDKSNGDIRLLQPFDRETTKTIVLALVVTDVHTVVGVDHATGQLTININDVNDNAPDFGQLEVYGSIKENMNNALISFPNGTGVLKLHATDADAVYNVVTLNVISNDHAPKYIVTIDSDSGYLTVGDNAFDYEKFHFVNLIVEALDNGIDPQLSANVSVNISVIDQNDNSPQFQNTSYTFYLPENSFSFCNGSTVFAEDPDSGVYGQVTYLIRDPACLVYFNISDTQGNIIVTTTVDYEQIQQIQGTIFAYDNFYSKDGSPINSDKTEATVKIIDENDNWPQFINQKVVITTPEDTNLQTPVGNVQAVDHDLSPKYSTLRFTLPNDTLFRIDENTGQVSVASSLIDLIGTHSVYVQVCDTGEPPNGPNCNATDYRIEVTDVNNHPPVIDYPQENENVPQKEAGYVDMAVLFVNITDQDTDIENKKSKFNMTAKCSLGPTVGQDAPQFYVQPYGVSELSAEVYFHGNFTREVCYVYQLFLTAININNPAMQSSLRTCFLVVQSVFPHPPEFPPGTVFEMDYTEEQPPGSPVFLPPQPYNPDDEGTGNASAVFCYIIGGSYADDFVITDHTYCNFTTAKILDREAIPSFDDMQVILVATEYDVQPPMIEHYDRTNVSQLLAHVRVIDINDNPPHFNQSQFFGGISSDTVKNTNFLNLTAYDQDTIDEGKLRFSIIGTPTFHPDGAKSGVSMNPFTLDAITGFICLDYTFSADQRGYVDFVVQVVDSNVTHIDRANVSVYVVTKSEKLICLAEFSPDVFISVYSETFARDFSDIILTLVVLDVVQMHVDDEGQKLNTLSDVFIHLVDSSTNGVIDAHTASNIIDAKVEALTPLYNRYHILRVNGPVTTDPIIDTKFYLAFAMAGALAVMLAATVSVCFYKGRGMRLKLKAATAVAFGSQQSGLNQVDVPNTNKHAIEGSNPVWTSMGSNKPDGNDFDTASDIGANSLQEIDDREEFQGGVNNPTFEQRVENVFKIADACNSSDNDNYDDEDNDDDNNSNLYDSVDNPEYFDNKDNDNFIFASKSSSLT